MSATTAHKADQLAAEAMAHFFLGMMKADGVITEQEEQKMKSLSQRYEDDLPCSFKSVLEHLDFLRTDLSYDRWNPTEHLVSGLDLLDRFIAMSGFSRRHLTNLMEMLEEVMHEDGIDESERSYFGSMEKELTKRFLKMVR